jgi:hypothetical protein
MPLRERRLAFSFKQLQLAKVDHIVSTVEDVERRDQLHLQAILWGRGTCLDNVLVLVFTDEPPEEGGEP